MLGRRRAPAPLPEIAHPRQAYTRSRYEALIAEHGPVVRRTALRLCAGIGDRDLADDLVQDALVRGYVAYRDGRFEEGTNARAWLLRILTNAFLNEYNRRGARPRPASLDAVPDDGPAPDPPAPASHEPDAVLMATTLDEPIERALAALSPPLRACVILVDIEGLEYEEAARALGVPIGTVRSRLSRARLQLHSLLYEYACATGRVDRTASMSGDARRGGE